jgi:RND family efflux transporter MFP subunit
MGPPNCWGNMAMIMDQRNTRPQGPRGGEAYAFALVCLLALLGFAQTPVAAQQPSLVHVEEVRYEPLTQTVPVIGRVISLQTGDVAARVAGPVEKFVARVGERVTKGQVVAVLDSETLKADRDLAESELTEAQAEHKIWVAELDVANTEFKRQQGLRKSTAFSQARFDDASKKVAVAESKVQRALANIAIRKAALKRKVIDVEYAEVRAPFEGVVIRRYTDEGDYVDRGERVLRIIGDRNLEIEAEVPSQRLSGLEVGRTVQIMLDDDSKHEATVRAILPSENPLTRTRTVRLEPKFEPTSQKLAHSQSVQIAVPLGGNRRVLTVHKDAILKRQGSDLVFVISGDVAEPRPIRLGESVGSRVEVLGGLKAGDQVVVRGNERLQPGAKVRVEKGAT